MFLLIFTQDKDKSRRFCENLSFFWRKKSANAVDVDRFAIFLRFFTGSRRRCKRLFAPKRNQQQRQNRALRYALRPFATANYFAEYACGRFTYNKANTTNNNAKPLTLRPASFYHGELLCFEYVTQTNAPTERICAPNSFRTAAVLKIGKRAKNCSLPRFLTILK